MRVLRALRAGVLILTGAVLLAGCTRKPPPTDPPDPQPAGPRRAFPSVGRAAAAEELQQIGIAYINCTEALGHPPRDIDELAEYYERNPALTDRLVKEPRLYKLFWDANPRAEGAILGFVVTTPDIGGVVLLTNGTTDVVTAEQFRTMDKAGKRTRPPTKAATLERLQKIGNAYWIATLTGPVKGPADLRVDEAVLVSPRDRQPFEIVWRVDIAKLPKGGADWRLGWERTADSKGGRCVLMADGKTAKYMTAAEFQKTPPAAPNDK
jgi:hypothetical protein